MSFIAIALQASQVVETAVMLPGSYLLVLLVDIVSVAVLSCLIQCIWKNENSSSCARVLVATLISGFAAFVFMIASSASFKPLHAVLLGFGLGIVGGFLVFGVLHLVINIILLVTCPDYKKESLEAEIKICWPGVLPSAAYLGYVISAYAVPGNYDNPYWFVRLLLIAIVGVLVMGFPRIIGARVNDSNKHNASALRMKNSPVLWLPLLVIVLIFIFKVWVI